MVFVTIVKFFATWLLVGGSPLSLLHLLERMYSVDLGRTFRT